MPHPSDEPISSLVFQIEQWDDRDIRVIAVLAAACNIMIGRAAYEAALRERPDSIVRLRNKGAVVAERFPEGLPRP